MTALPDSALVARGAPLSEIDHLVTQARKAQRLPDLRGQPALSVRSGHRHDGESDDAYLARICRRLPHDYIHVTTAGELRSRALELRKTGRDQYHYSVLVGTVDVENGVRRFVEALGPEREKPA